MDRGPVQAGRAGRSGCRRAKAAGEVRRRPAAQRSARGLRPPPRPGAAAVPSSGSRDPSRRRTKARAGAVTSAPGPPPPSKPAPPPSPGNLRGPAGPARTLRAGAAQRRAAPPAALSGPPLPVLSAPRLPGAERRTGGASGRRRAAPTWPRRGRAGGGRPRPPRQPPSSPEGGAEPPPPFPARCQEPPRAPQAARAARRPWPAGLEADGGSQAPRSAGAPLPPGEGRSWRGAGARQALPPRCGGPRPPLRAPYLSRARRRPSPGPAAAAPAGAGTERAAAPRRGPEKRAREREQCRPRRMMWVPLLACLTAGIVSVPRCQRGPGTFLGAARLLAAVPGLCQRSENRCATSNAVTCTKCLALGPECGWCAQEDFMAGTTQKGRCDTVFNLMKRGCQSDLVENPTVHVTIPSDHETNTQVTPGKVSVQLRPGSEANFMLKVRPLEKYPVDLYYLVDVSASMHNNIEKLNSVGFALSKKMENISLDFRLGFGSYVDKTVSPYISIHPGRIHNQCSDYNLDCMPPHGYIHVLSLTDNIAEFRNAVNKQKISGNIDTPEGGFDAMLQAAVCQSHIGWRKEAKRLLLVMTDQTSHLALDSKLAGIVIPHDGNCHLKDNVYIKATSMEHPSLGQLSEKLIDNNINVIFAVQGSQFHWYKDLLPLLPGTVARQIESQAANLNDLVVEAYQKLISEVKIQVDNQIQGLHFNITAICPDGSKKTGMEGCKNVGYNKEVLFNVSVTMKGCHTTGGRKYVILKPIGFNETAIVHVQQSCACQYGDSTGHKRVWAEETSPDSKQSPCSDSNCSSDRDTLPSEKCRQHQDQPICSGQGNCIDGKCFCFKNKLGKVYGKYCEMDDFSCPYHQGNLCSGNGECEGGKCKCFAGWEGDRCECSSQSAKQCLNSKGQICSGRGKCVCGKCECTDPRSFGRFCEYCPTCNKACEENWNCVQCYHSNNASQVILDQCTTSCTYLLHYIDNTSDCFSGRNYFRVFSIIFIVTFLIGLLVVLIIRQIILQGSSNKVKSSSDYRVSTTKKDKMFLPTVCTRTVTYRRDKPEEINIDICKLRLNETFKCEF